MRNYRLLPDRQQQQNGACLTTRSVSFLLLILDDVGIHNFTVVGNVEILCVDSAVIPLLNGFRQSRFILHIPVDDLTFKGQGKLLNTRDTDNVRSLCMKPQFPEFIHISAGRRAAQ